MWHQVPPAPQLPRNFLARFLQALIEQSIDPSVAAHVIALQRKEEILRALEENAFLFAATLENRSQDAMCGGMAEPLDTILLTATDALTSGDSADVELLVRTLARHKNGAHPEHSFPVFTMGTHDPGQAS